MRIREIMEMRISAMKTKDEIRKSVLTEIYGTAKNMAIAKKIRDEIPESIVDEAILKTVKMFQEQVDTCPAERADLMAEYTAKLAIAKEVAPKMLTYDEAVAEIRKILVEEVYPNINKGIAMKTVIPKMKGRADGKMIADIVDALMKGRI